MSYEKNIWKKGDKITAEKLNNIENGIANITTQENSQETSQDDSSNITVIFKYDDLLDDYVCNIDYNTIYSIFNSENSEDMAKIKFIRISNTIEYAIRAYLDNDNIVINFLSFSGSSFSKTTIIWNASGVNIANG